MTSLQTWIAAALLLGGSGAALADDAVVGGYSDTGSQAELAPYLQCVPYARQVSGVEIYGDAHTWWDQARGNFARGNQPRAGAVMAFQPHRNMRLGHVAAVSRVIDSRTVLLRHANWSPINGRRGQIENDVRAVDVSPQNDWSAVRVWYQPINALGKTAWPVHGFIYSGKGAPTVPAPRPASPAFANAFADLAAVDRTIAPASAPPVRQEAKPPRRPAQHPVQRTVRAPRPVSSDPLVAAVMRYD